MFWMFWRDLNLCWIYIIVLFDLFWGLPSGPGGVLASEGSSSEMIIRKMIGSETFANGLQKSP